MSVALSRAHTSAKAQLSPIAHTHRYQPPKFALLFSSTSVHYSLRNWRKWQKHPMSQSQRKRENNSWTTRRSSWGPFWAGTHPPSKFCRNLFNSFCVIQLTIQQNNQQTDTGEDTTSSASDVKWELTVSDGPWRGNVIANNHKVADYVKCRSCVTLKLQEN